MSKIKFSIQHSDTQSKARLGTLSLQHGTFDTPMFMPVGTRGVVKTLTSEQLEAIDSKIILGNTYHLMLRPGMEVIESAGGLHAFMNWKRPILTDSGGFQVFSLSSLNKINDHGVVFQSHIDGKKHFLGPNESMEIQKILGSDIVMAFDQCPPYPCSNKEMEEALERTHTWANMCKKYPLKPHQNLFGIVQGGVDQTLRKKSAKTLSELDLSGYAIGGLSVGEPAGLMYETLEAVELYLPKEKPRYLMGVGTPRNIIEGVMRGVDLFDCVMPTRNARNGTAFTWDGKIHIKAGRYAKDFSPLDPLTKTEANRYTRAYIRHLLNVDEITGLVLVTLQNLGFYLDFMAAIRQAIKEDTLQTLYQKICQIYPN